MKKLACVILIVTLALSGCAVLQKINPILAKAQAWICDPAADQVLDAVSALAFIQGNPAIAAGIGGAIEVFKNIRDKVCVSLPQIADAISKFDAAVAGLRAKGMAYREVPKLAALRAAVK